MKEKTPGTLYEAVKACQDKRSSLFVQSVNNEKRSFIRLTLEPDKQIK